MSENVQVNFARFLSDVIIEHREGSRLYQLDKGKQGFGAVSVPMLQVFDLPATAQCFSKRLMLTNLKSMTGLKLLNLNHLLIFCMVTKKPIKWPKRENCGGPRLDYFYYIQ